MLLLADLLDADEALAAGFLVALAEPDALETRVAEIVGKLLANAPLTLAATRALMRAAVGAGRESHRPRLWQPGLQGGGRGLSREAGAGVDWRVGPKRNHTIEQMSCLRFKTNRRAWTRQAKFG